MESYDGNFSSILKEIYEQSAHDSITAGPSLNQTVKLVSLTVATNLSFILCLIGHIDVSSTTYIYSKSLLNITQTNNNPNEVSFLEELLLETAETLISHNYPIEV